MQQGKVSAYRREIEGDAALEPVSRHVEHPKLGQSRHIQRPGDEVVGDVEVHKAVTLVEVTHWESADDGVVREVERREH